MKPGQRARHRKDESDRYKLDPVYRQKKLASVAAYAARWKDEPVYVELVKLRAKLSQLRSQREVHEQRLKEVAAERRRRIAAIDAQLVELARRRMALQRQWDRRRAARKTA